MKALISVVAILFLLISTNSVFASGTANTRATLNKKWKQVEAWQKKQDRQFKKIEREAEKSLREMRGQDGPVHSIPYTVPRTCP